MPTRSRERESLASQVQALGLELSQCRRTLGALAELDSSLHARVWVQFDQMLRRHETDLDALEAQTHGDASTQQCWRALRTIRAECTSLFRESLAFMGGACLRRENVDGGLCRIADHLLDDLSRRSGIHWGRLTTLAASEYYGDLAQIVRLRFPEASIWNLPVAAHEFGHFIGPLIKVTERDGNATDYRYPFQELLRAELRRRDQLRQRRWSHRHELFADVFATYTLGPAYAFTCVVLRFDPTSSIDSDQHPSPSKRFHVISRTLEMMSAEEGTGGSTRGVLKLLADIWRKSLESAGQPALIDDRSASDLDAVQRELHDLLAVNCGGLRYSSLNRALAVESELRPQRPPPRIDANVTLADVLNAAWVCRVTDADSHRGSAAEIGDRAFHLCAEIVERDGAKV